MNTYIHKFVSPCPNDDRQVEYEITIEVGRVIMAEDIVAACVEATQCAMPYHETMADFLYDRFGGQQVMRGHHHGVDIETRRG